MQDAFIIDAVRTPRARRKGKFAAIHPADLLTYPLTALQQRTKVAAEAVEDVLVGCVTQTGEQGWCVGRVGVLASGWPYTVPATTINRLCGSGQQAVNFAASGIRSGAYGLAIGGGLEHMTRCPMFSDIGGEESTFLKRYHPDLVQQGLSAELLTEKFGILRRELDEFAFASQMKAKRAQDAGHFTRSIVPVPYKDEQGNDGVLERDDNIRADTTIEALSNLKPVFKENGAITAGNASAIVDGAAALLLASEQKVKELKLSPRARVVAHAAIGSEPRIMLSGPIEASKRALAMAGLKKEQIDIWEINEAFAPVPIVTMREVGIDAERVNVNGGGISLGHPLGATGAMLIGMAVDELERIKARYALVTMCIGLGMGIATIVERV